MKCLPWVYPLTGLIIGWIAWGDNPAFMPLALLILPAWYCAGNRLVAWLTIFFYFAAASRGLPMATMAYFQTNLAKASVDWLLGISFVSIPFLLLFFKNKKLRLIGLYLALFLIAVPPFGLTCWTHPLAGTGMWLPGTGWFGLIAVFLIIPLFCRWPLLAALPVLSALLIPYNNPALPRGWQALDTNFSGTVGEANSFAPLTLKDFQGDFVKQAKTIDTINATFTDAKKINLVLLPESSGGTWLAGNEQLWKSRLSWPGTTLVGATVQTGQYKDSVILAVSNVGTKPIYRQRQPVPVSMWWPGRVNSYLAHWFNNPVVALQGHRVAFFICYEQFLAWPVLQSLWYKPDLLCATSSVWWATGTNIPAIQHNIMLSWSQLFSLPLLTATNS